MLNQLEPPLVDLYTLSVPNPENVRNTTSEFKGWTYTEVIVLLGRPALTLVQFTPPSVVLYTCEPDVANNIEGLVLLIANSLIAPD